MDADYSKRELDHMFKDVHEKLDLILVQTTKHNGRMTRVEERQTYVKGALAVISVVVIPILGWVLYKVVNLDALIASGIENVLEDYKVEVK